VGGADRVASHLLKNPHLTAECGRIKRRANWPEIMMEAYSFEVYTSAIQEKAIFCQFNRAYSESRSSHVNDTPVAVNKFAFKPI
jgi:hypothetical protein